MTLQTVTVKLPQVLYRRLERAAETTNQPLEVILLQTIRGNIPPSLDDAPADIRSELAELVRLTDEDLWAVASAPMDPKQWRRHRRLLQKNTDGALSEREQAELQHLRTRADQHVLRRSFAMALLKWRGYMLSSSKV